MKTKNLIILLLFIAACRDDNSIFENESINGLAFIHDNILQSADQPAEGITIYLTDAKDDSSKYIYSTKTTLEGRFSFSHQPEINGDEKLYLYAYYLSDSTAFVSEFIEVKDKSTVHQVIVSPRYKPGIKVIVRDSLSTPIFNVNVCVYSSIAQINSDSCEGSIRSNKTNDRGVAFFENLSLGKYFIRINDKVGDVEIRGESEKEFRGKNIDTVNIIINKKPEPIPGVTAIVLDSLNYPIAIEDVCLFTSEVLAQDRGCNGSIATQKTDALGKSLFENLPTATYFFVVDQMINNKEFNALGQIDYQKGEFKEIKLQAKKRPAEQIAGITAIVVDSLNTPLANVNVCLFTSEVLAQQKSCVGNIASQKTDQLGETLFEELFTGHYFFVVADTINNVPFSAFGDIEYTKGESRTIELIAKK